MEAGQIVAIVLAAFSTATLLITFYLLRKSYMQRIQEMSQSLGVDRRITQELEKERQLPGAIGLGRPVAISPKALEVFRGLRTKRA